MKFLIALDEEQAKALVSACTYSLTSGEPPDPKEAEILQSVVQVIRMASAPRPPADP